MDCLLVGFGIFRTCEKSIEVSKIIIIIIKSQNYTIKQVVKLTFAKLTVIETKKRKGSTSRLGMISSKFQTNRIDLKKMWK